MVKPPLVSIIVTNYNYARFLPACLRSIAEQTHEALEVFIVDDVSQDNSIDVIREFLVSNERAADWTLVALEQNGGQMNAFVEGFRRSSGAFVVFVDADDTLFPDFLETHVAAHLNSHTAAALSCSNEVQIDGEERLLAGTFENWHRMPAAQARLSSDLGHRCTAIEDWDDDWSFDDRPGYRRTREPLAYVRPADNMPMKWLWSSTSAMMFRRGALVPVLTDNVRHIRLSADFYMTNMAHMLGGTLLIHETLGCYRRHGTNGFALSQIVGRGTNNGDHAGGFGPSEMSRLMQSEILAHWEDFTRVVGEARLHRMIASLIPLRRLPSVLARIGFRPLRLVRFMAIFTGRYSRRVVLEKKMQLSGQ